MEKLKGNWDKPTPLIQLYFRKDKRGKALPICDVMINRGNWGISSKGHLFYSVDAPKILSDEGYKAIHVDDCKVVIYPEMLRDFDLILKFSQREWFTEKAYEDFKRAYFIACKVAGITPRQQIREYNHKP